MNRYFFRMCCSLFICMLVSSCGGQNEGNQQPRNTQLQFSAGIGYPVPATAFTNAFGDIATGDLNGDGRNDVAVIEANGSKGILIYCQNAMGALNEPLIIDSSLQLSGITVGDVNNDGLSDLVVSGDVPGLPELRGRTKVYIQNRSTHALDPDQEYALSTDTAGTLAIADLNSDGRKDIVVASVQGSNGLLSIFFQETGGLGAEQTYTSVPVVYGGEVHVADMNNDGRNDIIVQSDLKQLAVIKQSSPGIFNATPDYYTVQTSYWPDFRSFAVGDINGDGLADIVAADPASNGLNIFVQNSTGSITGPQILQLTPLTAQDEIKIADMNWDSLNDIVILSEHSKVQILPQTANHSFDTFKSFDLQTQFSGGTFTHQAMALIDVTSDGMPDVIATLSGGGLFVLPTK
ncbi:VCBS repeat-containing protein [Geobacter sulfurreducens]|uniref:Lipoprotein, putative n=2 Tax=Geobacter sulfurreducens TaxID=35554 RepID=Q74CY1_GEOSL|nr:lipoprotein, putative [Geobacter sulfurreducens PCA]ADI84377.1 lipoprotein, putative [Geobacter sulfurreducens KN400]UAC05548.1 VCBS repeat-containing protein [Geobacter sulfurreducens]HBB70958.1 VCBS repeat-containing protein [Geobacter sulfurreducens]